MPPAEARRGDPPRWSIRPVFDSKVVVESAAGCGLQRATAIATPSNAPSKPLAPNSTSAELQQGPWRISVLAPTQGRTLFGGWGSCVASFEVYRYYHSIITVEKARSMSTAPETHDGSRKHRRLCCRCRRPRFRRRRIATCCPRSGGNRPDPSNDQQERPNGSRGSVPLGCPRHGGESDDQC